MGQNQLKNHHDISHFGFLAHLARLLLKVDLPAVRVEAVAEGVERQDQVETRTDKCLKERANYFGPGQR